MVEVFVWKPGDPREFRFFHLIAGHASIRIKDEYFSFWSAEGKKGKRNIGLIHASPADFSRVSYEMDREDMGYEPDAVIHIDGLNERAMIADWKRIKANATKYQLFDTNCCTVAGKLLNVGLVNTDKWRRELADRAGEWLLESLRITENESLDSASGVPTMTPSVLFYYALLVKNAMEGYKESEDELHRRVKYWKSKTPSIGFVEYIKSFF